MTRAENTAAVRSCRRRAPLLVSGLIALMLVGCESGSSIFGGSTPNIFGGASSTTAAATPSAEISTKTLAIAPVIGAPTNVADRLAKGVAASLRQKSVAVVEGGGKKADYTVTGYVVAAPAKNGTKLSYIWDVTEPSGKRAHRVTGEEIVPGAKSKDPWANVNDAVVLAIADRTARALAEWVPRKAATSSPALASKPGVSGAANSQSASKSRPLALSATPRATTARPTPIHGPAKPRSVSRATPRGKPKPQLAALQKATDVVKAVVPPVVGAPGDGSRSLASALQRHLIRKGVAITAARDKRAYTVKGRVALGPPKNGKQSIRIEWQVLDPKGKRVGTVSQKNTIPQGLLDGKWGKTADAAAAAAANGILKLLPNRRAVN